MRKCTCPNCNAALEFSEDREFGFCEFCGTKIILDDVRILSKHEDVAEVKRIELEREKLHIEQAEKEAKREQVQNMKKVVNKLVIIATAIWAAVMIVLLIIWGLASLFGAGDTMKEVVGNVFGGGVLGLMIVGMLYWMEYDDAKDAADGKK